MVNLSIRTVLPSFLTVAAFFLVAAGDARAACDNYTHRWVGGASNYWFGTLGKAEFCNNAPNGSDRQKAADCAWKYTIEAFRNNPGLPGDAACARKALEESPQGSAVLDAVVRKWQVVTGADCSPASVNAFFNHWHGALGNVCNNASIGPDRQKAKECAFQALVRDKGVTPTSCLRDAIANSPQGRADLDTFVQKWKIKLGTDCSPASVNGHFNHWSGALDKECNNPSIGPDRQKAKKCAFQALVRDKGVAKTNSCLSDAIANSPQGRADLTTFVRKWLVVKEGVLPDQIGGSTVATNHSTVKKPPPERPCANFVADRDFYIAPKEMLDWTPTTVPGFKITLQSPLKALALGVAAFGGGTAAALLGPLLSGVPAAGVAAAAVAGGFTGLVTSGVPSELIGIPPTQPSATPGMYAIAPNSILKPLPGWLAPSRPIHIGANEGRLRADLRAAARSGAPLANLCKAAEYFALGDRDNGKAFADLSVTGRAAFAQFRGLLPREDHILPCLRTRSDPRARRLAASALQGAAADALKRAYDVAALLRAGGWPERCTNERSALGWIAVSGEDDQPHRPVNVPSAHFPQYDLEVSVPTPQAMGTRTKIVNTRYMIAHATPPAGPPTCASPGRRVPADPVPALAPDAQVILFVHGMDSRLEEALDLTKKLHEIGRQTGKNWTVISMDLPTSGYAQNFDHVKVSPIAAIGEPKFQFQGAVNLELTDLQVFNARGRHNVPLLDFIEDFIVAFVDRLEGIVPGVKARLKAVVGGSLGGNMAMRLGRRANAPWIRNVIPWSPAAIWPSFADGINPADHIAVAVPFMWAGGDPRLLAEKDFMRRFLFHAGFDWQMGVLKRRAQALEWNRESWDCKESHLVGARLDRHETYNRDFRLWHWRLGAEQLVFSQQGPPGSDPPYLRNTKPMLLMCGYEDIGGGLCDHTREVATQMENTPGKGLFLKDTGHSIQAERPCWLAQQIVKFLGFPSASCGL